MYSKTNLILFALLFCLMPSAGCQEEDLGLKSYDELRTTFYDHMDKGDTVKARLIAKAHNTKLNGDKENYRELINHHLFRYRLENFENKIAHLDTVISISKKHKVNRNFPALAHTFKGNLYWDRREFDKSLDFFLLALDSAEENKLHYLAITLKNNIGILKLERIGREREALALFKECKIFYDTIKDKTDYSADYAILLFSFSANYRKLGLIDSSSYYNKKGLSFTEKYNEHDFYGYFVFAEGVNDHLNKKPETALPKLEASEEVLVKNNDSTNLIELYYYLGKVNKQLGETQKAMRFFEKMDSLNNVYIDYSPQVRDGIEELINHYKKEGQLKLQLKYVQKLLKLDSINFKDYLVIAQTIDAKYNNRSLLDEKKTLEERLDESRVESNYKTYVLLFFLLALLLMFVYFRENKNQLLRRFDSVIDQNEATPLNTAEVLSKPKLDLPEEIVEKILSSLSKFEKNQEYLQRDLNTQAMAKLLGTNTKYLSKVVNFKKGKSINNYINDLRIAYCINRLKEDKQLRKFTMSSIADECGFSSASTFSKSFYKNTNLKPSYFVKQLNRSESSQMS